MNRGRLGARWRFLFAAFSLTTSLLAQPDPQAFVLREAAGSPLRFVSAAGQRAFIGGYGNDGLEFWAYPVQVLCNYRVAFRPAGATTFLDGRELLNTVETTPSQTTRIYTGSGLKVRETLFVPIDRPAAILTYQVFGDSTVDIEVRATPVLDLMWPAGMGGQSTAWNETLGAFILSEPQRVFRGHCLVANLFARQPRQRPESRQWRHCLHTHARINDHRAQLFITLNEKRGEPVEPALKALESEAGSLRAGLRRIGKGSRTRNCSSPRRTRGSTRRLHGLRLPSSRRGSAMRISVAALSAATVLRMRRAGRSMTGSSPGTVSSLHGVHSTQATGSTRARNSSSFFAIAMRRRA